MVVSYRSSMLLFVYVSCSVVIFSFFLIQSSYFARYPDIFSMAVTVDITLLLPLLYYFFTRKARLPVITVIPVFLLSILIASLLIPHPHQDYLQLIKYLIAPVELFVIGYLIVKVRQSVKRYHKLKVHRFDFMDTLSLTLEKTIGKHKAINILATEIAIFHYAFFGWKATPEVRSDSESFTYHKNNGYSSVIGVFVFLISLETIALHLLISQWSSNIAWIVSALSIYGIIFLFADLNSVKSRPIFVDNDTLIIRIGLRWFARIPLNEIKAIEISTEQEIEKDKRLLNAVLIGNPNIVIQLKNSLRAIGLYGISKEFDRIALSIDNVRQFAAMLRDD